MFLTPSIAVTWASSMSLSIAARNAGPLPLTSLQVVLLTGSVLLSRSETPAP